VPRPAVLGASGTPFGFTPRAEDGGWWHQRDQLWNSGHPAVLPML
jgi:hypothetical protein